MIIAEYNFTEYRAKKLNRVTDQVEPKRMGFCKFCEKKIENQPKATVCFLCYKNRLKQYRYRTNAPK